MSHRDIEREFELAREAYHENASYDVDGSVAACKLFLVACRQLLELKPAMAAHGGRSAESFEFDVTLIRDQLNDARRWLTANDPARAGNRIRHFSLEDYRP